MGKSTFFKDFKAFIARGNVIDMAVGVVIGGAFGKIVTALVNNIIMPLVGLATGGMNIADLKVVLKPAVLDEAGAVVTPENALLYGAFIQAVLDFLIIAICIFTMLRVMMNIKKKLEKPEEPAPVVEEAPAVPVETTEDILKDIRELLKK